MYRYEDEKPKLFTEDGSVIFSDIRDYVRAVITKSGAITMGAAIAGPKRKCGDSWLYMACVDRLVELGELREVTPDLAVMGQDRVFMAPRQ